MSTATAAGAAIDLAAVARGFPLLGRFRSGVPHGHGHINDTFAVTFDQAGTAVRYIFQRINRRIFKDIPALMENISRVTAHATLKSAERRDDDARSAVACTADR